MHYTFKHMLLAALPVVGLLITPTVSSAHDDDWRSGSYYDSPANEHEAYHDEKEARHEAFHSMPHSRREHRRFHRAERQEHRVLHRDLDNDWRGYGDRYFNPDWSRSRYGNDYYSRDW